MTDLFQLEGKDRRQIVLLGNGGSGRSTLAQALAARHRQAHATGRARAPRAGLQSLMGGLPLEQEGRFLDIRYWSQRPQLLEQLMLRFGQLGGALLVVSCKDPALAALRQQIQVAHRTRVPEIAVFLSKAVDVAADKLEEMEAQLRMLLHEEGYRGDDTLIVPGDSWSALCSDGKDDRCCGPLDELLQWMRSLDADKVSRRSHPFRMEVKEVSLLRRGQHVVASGIIDQGMIRAGHRVEVLGGGHEPVESSVADLRRGHRSLETAEAGEAVRVVLRGSLRDHLRVGSILARPGTVPMCKEMQALIYRSPLLHAQRERDSWGSISQTELELSCGPGGAAIEAEAPGGRIWWGVDDCLPARICLQDPWGAPAREGTRLRLNQGGQPFAIGVVTSVIS